MANAPQPPQHRPESGTDEAQAPAGNARTSARLAWILDECIRVPGTRLRFGFDPLVGLVPYGGEAAASAIGAVILAQAGRKGIPIRTLVRMGGNMLLNAAVGAIPVVGDLFSFWFKSNSRNYRLLDAYLTSEKGEEARGGWWPLLLVAGFLALAVLCNVLAWVLLWWLLLQGWEGLFA